MAVLTREDLFDSKRRFYFNRFQLYTHAHVVKNCIQCSGDAAFQSLWLVANSGLHSRRARVHDDVIRWKHFPRYWPYVRGIHRWPVNSPHKGQRRGALIFSLIYAWIKGWINKGESVDLRRNRPHSDVTVMHNSKNNITQHTHIWAWSMTWATWEDSHTRNSISPWFEPTFAWP